MSDTPKILDAPEMIWLNYGDIEQACTHDECYRDGDITWCADSVFDSDVKYVRADRIAALEVKVRELEAELQRRAKQIGVACMKHDLTHSLACGHCYAESRQQVERLVEAIDCCYRMLISEADTRHALFKAENILREALAAVEKERGNAKVSGAGTASAGLPGSAAGGNEERSGSE